MLSRIGERAWRWGATTDPWTNVYGLARTILALSTLLTLLFSDASSLFRPAVGEPNAPVCGPGVGRLGFFCLPGGPEPLRWVAIALLVVVASGWRPRLTGIPHWWISTSLQVNAMLTDGGDQIAAILTLLLLPVTLTDPRRWHWQAPPERPTSSRRMLARVTALTWLTAVRVQVAGIYFHAAIGKFAVQQWANGTALYYWLQGSGDGAAVWLQPFLEPLLVHGASIAMLTWGVMVLEYLLSTALFMPRRFWRPMLAAGLAFHGGIFLVQGISSFSVTMVAALLLYLRPVGEPLAAFRRWSDRLRRVAVRRFAAVREPDSTRPTGLVQLGLSKIRELRSS